MKQTVQWVERLERRNRGMGEVEKGVTREGEVAILNLITTSHH
jgi:hypothetical protein